MAKTNRIFIHAAIVLAISYIIALCFMLITKSLPYFSALDESGDVPMTDKYLLYNSRIEPTRLDENIVFVDVDFCKDRFEIAQVIEQIDALQPKVIGLDVFFRNPREPGADAMLENVVRKCKNLVITCILEDEQTNDNNKYNVCNRNFFSARDDTDFTEGFINLDSDGSSPVRTFTPILFLEREKSPDTLYCFAAQVIRLCNETTFRKLLQRAGNTEIIHYQPLRFQEIDKDEIKDNQELITGKIVLIGSLSEDLHNTPIHPQMRGMEIHAHIISTIFEEKYIDRLDNIWTKLLNMLFCYLFTLFCCYATTRFKKGVSILIKLAQIAILALAFFAGYYFFNHYRIDITYAWTIFVMGVVILFVDTITFISVWTINRFSNIIK